MPFKSICDMENYWLVINTLVECLEQGIDKEKVKLAALKLDTDLDRRLVDNLPTEETKRLKSVLERINYETYTE